MQTKTWLVVRNKHSHALKWREIAPGGDPESALQISKTGYKEARWLCTEIGPTAGFFFAERLGERVQVSVERYDPAGPGPLGHSESN